MNETVLKIVIQAVAVLLAITCHEVAHGYVAYLMGDNTAKNAGRLTLNPIKHIDIFGAISLFIFKFGWAKPVPINPFMFKNRKVGMVFVSLAGPVTNFILSFISLFFVMLIRNLNPNVQLSFSLSLVYSFLYVFYYLNLGLGLFNLIPIPPLDGSKVLVAFLPEKQKQFVLQYERYGMIFLLLLLYFGALSGILNSVEMYIEIGYQYAINFLLGLM